MLRLIKHPSTAVRATLGSLTALALAFTLALPPQATPAQALPAGLPTHFGFGLSAGQGDTWMPSSNIKWDYRYQYLTGGVNTKSGWETWNSNGTFASNYATESDAHGYIPVFPYYELLQSSGSCNTCGEGQRNLSNLNSPAVMNAYYQNFALLMQRLGPGSFGKTAIIDIEADFSGGFAIQAVNGFSSCYTFCSKQGNDPAFLNASVGSSGFAEVSGYPNNLVGYSQALAHLRDTYAPNVLLGYHLSPWAMGTDIGTDSNPTTDGAGLGQKAGTFLSKLGNHELIFTDPLDRDAGLYKVELKQNRWWDRNNVTFPNFTRWEQFLHGASLADGGRSILLWQVPVGNQYFDTLDNTPGHYQDNRPEYIFSHIPELISVGVIGAMFGSGGGNATTFTSNRDGITNPASFCTTDGISSGQICNNHTSTVGDDDGGYLRMQGAAYYTNPVSLSGGGGGTSGTSTPTRTPSASIATATPTPTRTSTPTGPTPTRTPTQVPQAGFSVTAVTSPASAAQGGTVSIAGTVTNPAVSPALIDLEVYDAANTKVAQQAWDAQTFTAGQPRTFTMAWQVPATAALGTYSVRIGVFSPGWGALQNWNGSAGAFAVTAAGAATPTRTPTATPTKTPIAPVNTPTRTPTPSGGAVQPGFTSTGKAAPATAARGSSVALTTSVKSNTAMAALVDVEVYDATGVKVFQQAWDNQGFGAGQTLTFASTWAVSSGARTGAYTVVIGVFSPGWTTLYNWNGNAATLTVN